MLGPTIDCFLLRAIAGVRVVVAYLRRSAVATRRRARADDACVLHHCDRLTPARFSTVGATPTVRQAA